MSFRAAQTIKRTAAGSYINGLFVNGGQTTTTIQASVQPMTGEDMKTFPEGRRLSDYVVLFTADNLQVLGETAGLEPDRLLWRGHEYECISVEVRQMNVINHYKYTFSKLNQL
jgi:hypothetical protein